MFPANEALSTVLQLYMSKTMARVLGRKRELCNKDMEVLLAGDSALPLVVFAPQITIKKMLLRNIMVTL